MTKYINFPPAPLVNYNSVAYGEVYLTDIQKKALVCFDYVLSECNNEQITEFINHSMFLNTLSADDMNRVRLTGLLHQLIHLSNHNNKNINELQTQLNYHAEYISKLDKIIKNEFIGTEYSYGGTSQIDELKEKIYINESINNEVQVVRMALNNLKDEMAILTNRLKMLESIKNDTEGAVCQDDNALQEVKANVIK